MSLLSFNLYKINNIGVVFKTIPSYLVTDAITETARLADDPNHRHDSKHRGALKSVSEIDEFLSKFNHENNYCYGDDKLNLGDLITIADGTHNIGWLIAGFDCEHNRTAADGTVYDNGYGIMLYPRWINFNGYWNTENTTVGGYINSLVYSKINQFSSQYIENVVGSHIVNRNVLLSSSIDTSTGIANGYTWTTAKATSPSYGQLSGQFYNYNDIYDYGEANYGLPLFNYQTYATGYNFWLRNIGTKYNSDYRAYYIGANATYIDQFATNYSSNNYVYIFYMR